METKMWTVIRCYRRYPTVCSRFMYTFLQIKREENKKERKEAKEGEMREKENHEKIKRNYIKWAIEVKE